jgi:hypothetical protein
MDEKSIRWEPRVKPALIRKLYEADAAGLVDEKLINEVGYALLLRCETIQRVTERRCPHCIVASHWTAPSTAVRAIARSLALAVGGRPHGTPTTDHTRAIASTVVGHTFVEFLDSFPKPRDVSAKMLVIDRLIHAVHETPGANVSAAASNLIYEKKPGWAKAFLDDLAYGDQKGTERDGLRETYLKRIGEGRIWAEQHRKRSEARGAARGR